MATMLDFDKHESRKRRDVCRVSHTTFLLIDEQGSILTLPLSAWRDRVRLSDLARCIRLLNRFASFRPLTSTFARSSALSFSSPSP
eukprot:599750-Pleurochrysis_carterae.AAC.1